MTYRQEILEQVNDLPPIPHVAIKLSVQLKDPGVDVNDLVETVKCDPALTARLIVMSNSAYLGGSGNITSLKEALVRLGNKQIYMFVVSTAVQPMMNNPLDGYGLGDGEMWRKGIVTAVVAEALETKLGGA